MKPCRVDFKECLKDSPKFRATLEEAEQDLDQLEIRLEKLMKLCNGMVDAGKVFSSANSSFVMGLREVAAHFRDDDMAANNQVSDALGRFTKMLSELQKYHNILLEQAYRSIVSNLSHFIKNDIRKVKETRKHFEKISNDTDAALVRNAQVMRNKPHEAEEAANTLTAMYSCFCHVSLDYVFQINVLHSKKKFDVLDTVLAYMHAQNAYFHQGFDLFADAEAYLKQVASQSEGLSAEANVERKDMENRHQLVQDQKVLNPAICPTTGTSDNFVRMEGYLFKRTTNTFKTWVRLIDRRWFMILNNQLVYRKRSKDTVTIMEEDLRLCTVRPSSDLERRFCFEVLSPSRSHVLQADSDSDCQVWIQAIQSAVSNAYHSRHRSIDVSLEHGQEGNDSSYQGDTENGDVARGGGNVNGSSSLSTPTLPRSGVKQNKQSPLPKSLSRTVSIMAVAGNKQCCDCGHPDPAWASINLGITLCIECSGIHRSFGVHVSKVRGITLDAWEPDLLRVMAELGNAAANSIYEANVDESIARRATSQSTRPEREAWIRAKYITKAFIRRIPNTGGGSISRTASDVHSSDTGISTGDVSGSNAARRWSVCKRKRTSPVKKREAAFKDSASVSSASTNAASGGEVNLDDVIVFGAGVNDIPTNNAAVGPVDDSGSEDSLLGEEVDDPEDDDIQSLTSLEDLSVLSADLLIYKAARVRNLRAMLEAIALGGNVNWVYEADVGRTPLIQAVLSGSMTTVEFLLLNGAKVDIRDSRGQGPLHHATVLSHTGQVCQLLKKNANLRAIDELGQDPLSIAVKNANADIVTLLRLAKLNEEMRDTDDSARGDETVNDVFRDFTNRASHVPERLTRNK